MGAAGFVAHAHLSALSRASVMQRTLYSRASTGADNRSSKTSSALGSDQPWGAELFLRFAWLVLVWFAKDFGGVCSDEGGAGCGSQSLCGGHDPVATHVTLLVFDPRALFLSNLFPLMYPPATMLGLSTYFGSGQSR